MEQVINLIDQLSQKITTLTTKKIPKISFSKKDNEWRRFISQWKPHWEDITWRVKVPNESGESEVHLGFYSAKTSDILNTAIIEVSNEFQSKTDNIIKNENGIRLVWNVNVNDPESIDKVVTAITDIITNFFKHAQKVLFGGKAAITSTAVISKKENTIESVSTTDRESEGIFENLNPIINDEKEEINSTTLLSDFIGYTGKGKYIFDDGNYYDGEWENGHYHGEGYLFFEEGNDYKGSFKKSLFNGFGIRKHLSGDIYSGAFANAFYNGIGELTFADGSLYKGDFVDGKFNGQGIYTFESGAKYSGRWTNDERCGSGTMEYSNGDLYEGDWEFDKKNGHGIMIYNNGDQYKGEWKDGLHHGQGKMTYGEDSLEGADTYEGEWENNLRHGQGKITYNHKALFNFSKYSDYEGEWNDDNHHFGKMTYVNGDVYEGSWSILGPEGNGKMTYDNGDVYEGNWSEGTKHGYGVMNYANKDFYFGYWIKGIRHGNAVSKINGEATMLWENDKPKIEIKWDTCTWDNGNHYEGYCKGNHPHGEGKKTYADGSWRKGEFEEGEFISGKGKIIYKSGDYYEGELKGSQRHGYGEYHFKTGGVLSGNYYEDLRHGRIFYDYDGDGKGYYAEYVYDERKYKEGSVVQLKSGGPKMTVTDVLKKKITCNWLNRGKPYSEEFDEDMLKLIE